MKRKREIRGNEPGADKWFLASESKDWRMFVYRDSCRDGNEWINLKFVSDAPDMTKANYWLSWSRVRMRFAGSAQYNVLRRNTDRLRLFTDMVMSFVNE